MSDYDDGWNEGFDLGARKVKELQAELADKKTLIRSAQLGWDIESDKVAKLEAVVDAAKVVVKERGIHRYYKPMDVAIDAMLDAIKEVESDA